MTDARKESSLGITLEQSEMASVLRLEGVIDISSAGELKEQLLKALESGQPVHLALEGATDLDVTAVQLLWAAERKAKSAGLSFGLDGTVPETVSTAWIHAGFQTFLAPLEMETR